MEHGQLHVPKEDDLNREEVGEVGVGDHPDLEEGADLGGDKMDQLLDKQQVGGQEEVGHDWPATQQEEEEN